MQPTHVCAPKEEDEEYTVFILFLFFVIDICNDARVFFKTAGNNICAGDVELKFSAFGLPLIKLFLFFSFLNDRVHLLLLSYQTSDALNKRVKAHFLFREFFLSTTVDIITLK